MEGRKSNFERELQKREERLGEIPQTHFEREMRERRERRKVLGWAAQIKFAGTWVTVLRASIADCEAYARMTEHSIYTVIPTTIDGKPILVYQPGRPNVRVVAQELEGLP